MLGFNAISTTPISGELAQATYYYTASGGLSIGNNANNQLILPHTASGSLSLENSANLQTTYIYPSSGGLNLSDSANLQTTYIYPSSGGLNLGNTSEKALSFPYEASGGLNLNNSANSQLTLFYTASGGLNLSDSSPTRNTYIYEASGGLNLNNTSENALSFSYEASGSLNLNNSSPTRNTYIYEASGSLNLSDSANLQINYTYETSGGLNLGNTGENVLSFSYEASGSLNLSDSSPTRNTYIYEASGSLNLSDSSPTINTYIYEASGGLSVGGASENVLYLYYTASGGLSTGDTANNQLIISFLASGSLNLSDSSPTRNTYIYEASGSLNLSGSAQVIGPDPISFSYEASGGLNVDISNEVSFYKFRPIPGYWEAIKDEIQKARELRLICNEPISEYVFINQLKNEKVRKLIESANSWHVICYLGNNVYDIQIDGVRMSVSTDIQILPVEIETQSIPTYDTNGTKQNDLTHIPNEIVLSRLQNDRIKTMLSSSSIRSWFAVVGIGGKIDIKATTTSGDIIDLSVDLDALVSTPTVTSPNATNAAIDNNGQKQNDLTHIPNEIVLSRLQNDRIKTMLSSSSIRSWFAVAGVDGKINIKATTTSGDIIDLSVDLDTLVSRPTVTSPNVRQSRATPRVPTPTVSQDVTINIFGPNSFLNNMPRSEWTVLGFRGNKLEVRLKNGVVVSK